VATLTGCDLPFASQEQSEPPSYGSSAPDKSEKVSPEGTESTQSNTQTANLPLSLYIPNDTIDGFDIITSLTDGSAQHIVSLLVSEKALPEGCALLSFTPDSKNSGTADMNAAYLQAISEGTASEYVRLGCVVNTLLTYFDLDEITLTIEGKTLETGHEVYDYPLRFYENQIADLGDPTDGNQGDYPSLRAQNYDVPVIIGNLPRSDSVDSVWAILSGYWTATDDLYVAFLWKEGLPCVTYGIWDAGGIGFGELVNADPMSDYEFTLSISFPATEANEAAEAREEFTVTVFIDASGLDQDGKINIKIENHGDSGYYTYAYGGATAEEAYRSVRQ
jgi:hypothetical protein